MQRVQAKNPAETEFLQAVKEVVESVWRVIERTPRYKHGKVLDRLFRSEVFDSLLSSASNRPQVETIVAESYEHHRRIAEAFAAGDADAMVSAAHAHLAAVEHRMVDELM